jgi:hypothetical protein
MNKHPFFRYKKAVLFFVAVGLIISFSNCSKTTDNNHPLINTVWKSEVDDTVIELSFNDAKTCSISQGQKNAYAVILRQYDYEQGFGIDLFFYEKTDTEKGKTIFTGQFKKQNELTLFGVENNVAVYEYATFKKIK